jgi:uncharacterized lipoprotein
MESLMKRKILFALFIAVVMSGCATVQTAKGQKGSGETRQYSKPIDVVWPAVTKAIEQSGGKIEEKNDKETYVLASYGVSAWSWGEKVAVFCSSVNENTSVEIVTKRALATNITSTDWTPKLFKSLDELLK